MDAMFSHAILLIFVHILLYTHCTAQEGSLVVHAPCGSLRGRLEPVVNELWVRQYLGIPYAQPPTGQLRFARPQPAKQWTGIQDAVTFGPQCPQHSMRDFVKETNESATQSGLVDDEVQQSEDCLFLNVYTPSYATTRDKLAVMVWIHGGAFELGKSHTYNPSVLVALNDVIVVTINYRLGVLGFFNIPGTDIKGNFGLYDQIEAFKWVQQNIAAFGGDPGQVTIFGESAGGMSVSYHLISPLSKGLFHRVIAQSGSSATPFSGLTVKSTKAVETFSKAIHCDVKDEELMECLRNKNMKDILKAQRNVSFPMYTEECYLTVPTVDGEFLPDEPKNLLKQGKASKAEVMMGVTSNEGGFFYALFIPEIVKGGGLDLETFKVLSKQSVSSEVANSPLVQDAIVFEYVDHSNPDNRTQLLQAGMDIWTDNLFLVPAVMEARALAQSNHVYFYVFDHTPHFTNFPPIVGAYHAIDVPYVFGMPFNTIQSGKDLDTDMKWIVPNKYSELEVGFSRYIMRLWTSFAKHGDPNTGDAVPVTWPRYNTTGHVHLRLTMEPRVEHSLRERKVAFWNEFVPKLTEKDDAHKAKSGVEQKQKDEL